MHKVYTKDTQTEDTQKIFNIYIKYTQNIHKMIARVTLSKMSLKSGPTNGREPTAMNEREGTNGRKQTGGNGREGDNGRE